MADGSSSQHSMQDAEDPDQDLNHATQHSLSSAVHARKSEFVRPHRIRIKIGSWNVAAAPGTDKDLASWFVEGRGLEPHLDSHLADQSLKASGTLEDDAADDDDGDDSRSQDNTYVNVSTKESEDKKDKGESQQDEDGEDDPKIRLVGGSDIGLYVLGLQEIISLNIISGYADTTATEKWQAALEAAMPPYYKLIASQQLSGLLLLMYASPDVAATISDVSTVSVGTGLLGYMGNKGGVSTRIVLGETTRVVFTNSHLASGHDQTNLERRWWDYNRILAQTQFSPISHSAIPQEEGEKIGDEDFTFWFGDLNFRLDGLPGDDIRRLLMLHTSGEYGAKKDTGKSMTDEEGVIVMRNKDDADSDGTDTPGMVSRETSFDEGDDDDADLPDPDDFVPDPHDDPASLQATLDSLLPHDQLAQTIKKRKAFHEGWSEGPITFLPSYKYDIGTIGLFDSSEKRRAPSWCDRILFRTKTDLDNYRTKILEEDESKKRDEDMKKRGIDTAADDESVLFDYDPDKDTSTSTVTDSAYDYDEYDEGNEEAEGEGQTVLTREGFEDHIRLDLYATHQRITSSDHKPVVALFTLDYDAVVPDLKAKVHAEVARELDRAENEGRPGITIVVDNQDGGHHEDEGDDGSGGVDFGDVSFLEPATRSLTVANTGGVPATVSFVGKPGIEDESTGTTKRSDSEWLSVSLHHSPDTMLPENETESRKETHEIVLEPGETASATLAISVASIALLRSLNAGTTSLEDVLVLRVADGRDHFIPIRAKWAPSCFGRSIEELIRVPPRQGGLRGFTDKLQRDNKDVGKDWKGGSIPYSLDVHSSSPPELYKLTAAVEALSERVMADESMVQEEAARVPRDKAGWPFANKHPSTDQESDRSTHLASIIRALDTDDPTNLLDAVPKTELTTIVKLEIFADALLIFLRSLTDGIIPAQLFGKIEATLPSLGTTSTTTRPAQEIEDDKSAILDILSAAPYNNISFVFVTSMLVKLAVDVTPLNAKELEILNSDAKNRGKARSLSFRKSILGAAGSGVDQAALQRRTGWERKVAEVFGPAVCRRSGGNAAGDKSKDKERKASELRMAGLIEIFLRRRDVSR